MQVETDADDLIRTIKERLEQQINRPAPSWELIGADLKKAADAIGPLYTAAKLGWARVWLEAWNDLEAAVQDVDDERKMCSFLRFMSSNVEYWGVSLLPAKHLRNELAQRLQFTQRKFIDNQLGAAGCPTRLFMLPTLNSRADL
jgi:hypothetical protein